MLLANAIGTGLKNLVTGNTHTGSWGTTDYGITESIQRSLPFGSLLGTTSQNGSNLNPFNNSVATSPSVVIPSVTPQPQPQPQPNNGGLKTTTTPTASTPVFPAQPDSGVQDQLAVINQMHDANQAYYAQQRDSLQAAYPQYEKQITDSYNTSIAGLDAQKQAAMDQITGQKNSIEQSRLSAISTARKLYNELLQQGAVKFGAGSSAGPAYAALIGKQTSANIGGAQTASIDALSKIASEQNNLSTQYAVGKQTIEDTYNKNIFAVQQQLKDQLAQISRDESLNFAAKNAQSLQAMQTSRDQAYNYQLQKAQWDAELMAYAQAQSQNYNNAIAQQMSTVLPPEQIDALVNSIRNANKGLFGTTTSQTPTNNITGVQGYTNNIGLSEEQKRLLRLNPLYNYTA